jgi:hypothetical protein
LATCSPLARAADVSCGSNSEVELTDADFLFTPQSRHPAGGLAMPKVAGCSEYTTHRPLKGVLTKDLELAAMVRERDDWGYYVRAIRDLTHPPSWRWRIIRRGNPMGVLLEAGGFSTYEAARFAGKVALADFLTTLNARNCGTTRMWTHTSPRANASAALL